MDTLFKLLNLLGSFVTWFQDGQLDRQIARMMRELLTERDSAVRRFDTLLHAAAIYDDDPNGLRKILIRIGARRFRNVTGDELWGLPERNRTMRSEDPYPMAKRGAGVVLTLGAAALVLVALFPDDTATVTSGARQTPPDATATAASRADAEREAAAASATEPSRPATPRATAQDVRDLQQQLQRLGFYTGRVDGLWGRQSERALESYQRAQSLIVDGRADAGVPLLPRMRAQPTPTAAAPTAAAPAATTPTAPPRTPAQPAPPAGRDCTVIVDSPFVRLRSNPGFREPEGVIVEQGSYAVQEAKLVRHARQEWWFRIRVAGRDGWIAPAFHHLSFRGGGCP